ncbi:hypothetical protein [Catenulispora subtropica]|uniref:Histidine kinase n=1 Tax=Catenulispora subtropica TaxID=450798 RepID=A0ABN2SF31_9ACTN
MDLTPYVDGLREELLAAAEPGEPTALAERLAASVAAATRLTMLDVLSAAMDEVSAGLAPGSVHVRLSGRNPVFVVIRAEGDEDGAGQPVSDRKPAPPAPASAGQDGPVSRINFRPPEQLKQRIEAAAGQEGLSTNTWLVRVVAAVLDGDPAARTGRRSEHFTGWVG